VNLVTLSARKAGTAAFAAVLAGVSLAGCTAKESASEKDAAKQPEITVNATDTACELSGTDATTGPSTFLVANNGTKVTEFYVYGEGDRVMGEVENISPGLQRRLVVHLARPGTYQTACKPGMVGDGIRAAFNVTGEAVQVDTNSQFKKAADEYKGYVVDQTDALVADVKELNQGVKATDYTIDSTQIAGGAQGLLDEISRSKITGEEDTFSHTDLWDFQADVDGSKTAVASVRPILDERNADLGKRVDQRFADVEALLSKYRSGDGFVLYDTVTEPQRQELSRSIDALSNEVSQVQGVIAPQ
jgi:iron uptake system EfeUOB component EfeO/EfeM